MDQHRTNNCFQHLSEDIPAGIVVFLVALPLCLGIALASGAPLLSGMITGIIGGLVVAWASGSQLCISGPAAGLAVIALNDIETLGGYPVFLLSVMLAGGLQLALGGLKAGIISAYFPSAVIKGMLAAIGLILMLKQIPHALGYDADFEGDETFLQSNDHTTLSELLYSLQAISAGAVIVSVVAIIILLVWETRLIKRQRWLSLIPGPLLAVAWGIGWNALSRDHLPGLSIAASHLANLPVIDGLDGLARQWIRPDFSQWTNPSVYRVAVTLALIASLESLLSLEAVDKLDPLKRVASSDRELKAQGLGNLLCGLLGGLPMTALIVRSSANISAGGKTKVANFVHGLLLLCSVLFLGPYLNQIPLAALAAILLVTGYRLCPPGLFQGLLRKSPSQSVPFMITVAAILFSDLLTGIAIGMLSGLYYVVRTNFHSAITLTRNGRHYLLRLQKDASFLNKAPLRQALGQIEGESHVIIDGTRARFIDSDIIETIEDFITGAKDSQIQVELKNIPAMGSANSPVPTTQIPAA
jgi:MFS superfamily sulfate permease-like transporter